MTIIGAVLISVYVTAILLVTFWPTRHRHPEDRQAIGCLMGIAAILVCLGIVLAIAAWFRIRIAVAVVCSIAAFPAVILLPQLARMGIQKLRERSVAKGIRIPADQLFAKLSGQTHVVRCGSLEPRREWNELRYYAPDGRVVEYEEEAGQTRLIPGDIRWSIDGDIFETLNDIEPGNRNRYVLRETPDGQIAYYIYVPASRINGKLSRKTVATRSGEPVATTQGTST